MGNLVQVAGNSYLQPHQQQQQRQVYVNSQPGPSYYTGDDLINQLPTASNFYVNNNTNNLQKRHINNLSSIQNDFNDDDKQLNRATKNNQMHPIDEVSCNDNCFLKPEDKFIRPQPRLRRPAPLLPPVTKKYFIPYPYYSRPLPLLPSPVASSSSKSQFEENRFRPIVKYPDSSSSDDDDPGNVNNKNKQTRSTEKNAKETRGKTLSPNNFKQSDDKIDEEEGEEDSAAGGETICYNVGYECHKDYTEISVSTSNMHRVIPDLKIDLSELNCDMPCDELNVEKPGDDDDVPVGCGRVIALAKHFSELCDDDFNNLKTKKINSMRQFLSEQDINLREKCFNTRGFKSDDYLFKADKSTFLEKEYGMNYGDIEVSKDFKMENLENINNKNGSKLSLEEQEILIKQAENFFDLDNVDAPFGLPDKGELSDYEAKEDDDEAATKNEKCQSPVSTDESTENSKQSVIEVSSHREKIITNIKKKSNYHSKSLPVISTAVYDEKIDEKFKSDKSINLNKDFLSSKFQYENQLTYMTSSTASKLKTKNSQYHENMNMTSDIASASSESELNEKYLQYETRDSPLFPTKDKIKFPNSFIRMKKLSKSEEILDKKINNNNNNDVRVIKSTGINRSMENIKKIKQYNPHITKKQSNSVSNICCHKNDKNKNDFTVNTTRTLLKKKSPIIIKKIKSKSDLDISRCKLNKPLFVNGNWIFPGDFNNDDNNFNCQSSYLTVQKFNSDNSNFLNDDDSLKINNYLPTSQSLPTMYDWIYCNSTTLENNSHSRKLLLYFEQ